MRVGDLLERANASMSLAEESVRWGEGFSEEEISQRVLLHRRKKGIWYWDAPTTAYAAKAFPYLLALLALFGCSASVEQSDCKLAFDECAAAEGAAVVGDHCTAEVGPHGRLVDLECPGASRCSAEWERCVVEEQHELSYWSNGAMVSVDCTYTIANVATTVTCSKPEAPWDGIV